MQSIVSSILGACEPHASPGAGKKRHAIYSGPMFEGRPVIEHPDTGELIDCRQAIRAHRGLPEPLQDHDMPACGHERCLNPRCLRDGQKIPRDELPRRLVHGDIFRLGETGGMALIGRDPAALRVSSIARIAPG